MPPATKGSAMAIPVPSVSMCFSVDVRGVVLGVKADADSDVTTPRTAMIIMGRRLAMDFTDQKSATLQSPVDTASLRSLCWQLVDFHPSNLDKAMLSKRMNWRKSHGEHHYVSRTGWLRAAVLGANDGILSTASLMLGVASATHSHGSIVISGLSGLVAGALSMAAGEYVSVSSQSDTEKADLEQERLELSHDPKGELRELTKIYVKRGLEPALAEVVAEALSQKDALAAHAHDELGISKEMRAKPVQAAVASAASFAVGAAVPLVAGLLAPISSAIVAVYATSLAVLVVLGLVGAKAGGAPLWPATVRVTFWGAFAMAVTAAIGTLFHVQV